MNVCELPMELEDSWQVFTREYGTLYHDLRWRKIIEDGYGFRSHYLIAENDRRIEGILPLFEVRSLAMHKRLLSIPFCPFAGIVATTKQAASALHSFAVNFAAEIGANSLEYRNFDALHNSRGKTEVLNKYCTMIRGLESNEEELWNNLGAKIRNQTRKAQKSGVKVLIGHDYLVQFYKIYTEAMHELGTPCHKFDFMKSIVSEFNKSARIFLVVKADEPIGGMLLIHFKGVAYDLWAVCLKEYFSLSPNNVLYFEALREAITSHVHAFDFGRSEVQSGTFEFKKHWGAVPYPLSYEKYNVKGGSLSTVMNGYRKSGKYLSEIWKRIPPFAANWIGPRVRRFLI